MTSLGYVAGNSQRFNFWKLVLLIIVLAPIVTFIRKLGDQYLVILLGIFIIGYLLPSHDLFSSIWTTLKRVVKWPFTLRWRKPAKERKNEEAFQQGFNADDLYNRREQERQQRKAESEQFRQQQSDNKKQQNKQKGHSEKSDQKEYKQCEQEEPQTYTKKQRYLMELELDPNKEYTKSEIKKAYRRMVAKYHPDKYQPKGQYSVSEMCEKFNKIRESYERLISGIS